MIAVCRICKKKYFSYGKRAKKTKWCSVICRDKDSNFKKRMREIRRLSKGNTGKKHTQESKDRMSISHSHPCSEKRKNSIREAHLQRKEQGFINSQVTRTKIRLSLLGKPKPWIRGENNPLWKGGVSKINKTKRQLFMETIEYKNWSRLVKEYWSYTCQICGKRGGKIRSNHIKRYIDYPELRLKLDNGIVICENCDNKLIVNREKSWESYFSFCFENKRL